MNEKPYTVGRDLTKGCWFIKFGDETRWYSDSIYADIACAAANAAYAQGRASAAPKEGEVERLRAVIRDYLDVLDNAPEESSTSELRSALSPASEGGK